MLIRSDIVLKGIAMLKPWKSATEKAKILVLFNWSSKVEGLTAEEICLILRPDEIYPNGLPRNRPLKHVRSAIHSVRHSALADGLIVFSAPRKVKTTNRSGKFMESAWFIKDLQEKYEWDKIVSRFQKVIEGYQTTIKKFNVKMDVPLSQRRAKIQETLDSLLAQLKAEEINQQGNNNKKKKKRGNQK